MAAALRIFLALGGGWGPTSDHMAVLQKGGAVLIAAKGSEAKLITL